MVAVKITMIRNINYYRPGELFLCSDPGWTAGLSGSRDDTIDTGWWVNNDVQREPLWRVCVRTPRVRRYKLHAAQVKLILRNFTSDPGSPARSIRPPSSKQRIPNPFENREHFSFPPPHTWAVFQIFDIRLVSHQFPFSNIFNKGFSFVIHKNTTVNMFKNLLLGVIN